MPIYQYQCTVCGKLIDEMFKITDVPNKIKCQCGANASKVFSAPNIRIINPVHEARVGRGKG